jgi:membrane protein DedA with SNARE-associated domain
VEAGASAVPRLVVGVVSAVVGDNLGYWIGRRHGIRWMRRYSHWVVAEPERFETMRRFMLRYGPLGVFVARFLPGLRFLAGPLAGVLGLPVLRFGIANALGAIVYVPVTVGAGYAVGYGLGDRAAYALSLAVSLERRQCYE